MVNDLTVGNLRLVCPNESGAMREHGAAGYLNFSVTFWRPSAAEKQTAHAAKHPPRFRLFRQTVDRMIELLSERNRFSDRHAPTCTEPTLIALVAIPLRFSTHRGLTHSVTATFSSDASCCRAF